MNTGTGLESRICRIIGAILCVAGAAMGLFTITAFGEPANTALRCRIELDREVLPADADQTAILKISLEAPKVASKTRPPVNLAVVLDRSGSMSGEKIQKAREAAIEALRRLGAADQFSLVMYDHNVETLVPAQSAANTESIEGRIRRIEAGGNTALFGGVSQAASEVRKNLGERYIHRIILLSDGLANVGPSSPEELGRLGAALIKEGISISTVGVGTDYNEDLMTRLSQNSDGNAYFVKQGRDLPDIFARELGDVLNVAAKKLRIRLELGDNITPVEIIGRDGTIRGQTVEISLNQLYGGMEKFALIKIKVPAGKDGTRRDIAVASVAYEDAVRNVEAKTSANLTTRFSADSQDILASANVTVQRQFFYNSSAIAVDDAIGKADKGNVKEAAIALRASARNLREAASALKDANLSNRAEEVEQKAQKLDEEGMSSESRKWLRTDNYQIYNQQKSY